MNTDMHGEEIFCLQILKSLVSGFQKLLSALIRLTCPPKSDSAAVRVSEDQGEGGSAKIRARIHPRRFAATVFNFNDSCCSHLGQITEHTKMS